MKYRMALICLLAPLSLQAASGSWVADSVGATLEYGGERGESPRLRAPNELPDADARITSVSWRYRLLAAEPAGMQVQLCTLTRCISLGGQWQQHWAARRTGKCRTAFCLLRAGARQFESAAARDQQSGDC